MTTWSFVRHGESIANAEGWFAGHCDTALTTAGEAQAIAARRGLEGVPVRRAFASDLQRAWRTAELLLEGRGLTVTATPALRERCCGAWERRSIAEISAAGDMQVFASWTGRPPGGESLRDTAARALRFLREIDDGTDTLIVAHGALLRATVGLLDGLMPDAIGLWRPRNCEVIVREYPRGLFATLTC
jgi:broad specificity phosphatase PhoE